MNKTLFKIALVLVAAITLSGCGAIPNMTEDQSGAIEEYAASLLLKYDTDKHSRLIDTDAMVEKYNKAWDEYNEAKEAYEKQVAKEERKKQKEEEKAQAETIDKSENSGNSNSGATIIDTISIAQFLDIDYDIAYSDYSKAKTYPEDGTDFFFSMDATSGHDLLIVKFNATNLGSDTNELDVMSKNLSFKLSINGKGFYSAYKTMLDDDFSEFVGTFNPGESKTLVLIAEVEEGTDINSIDLRISDIKGNVVTKQLLK